MFCPQCGQKQVSNEVRFCSSCGLPLNNVTALLVLNGQLPPPAPVSKRLTPRQKGIRQGAMMMLSTMLIVPLVAILGVAMLDLPGEIAGLAAVICFVGGLLRLLYAIFLEENDVTVEAATVPQYVPPAVAPNYLGTPERGTTLPPASANPSVESYRRPRYDTGELPAPISNVTDHTTRLLKHERDEDARDSQP